MSKSKPDTNRKQRSADSAKSRRIRQAIEDGKEVSPEELEWLQLYLESKSNRGRPIKVGADVVDSGTAETDSDENPNPPSDSPVEVEDKAPPVEATGAAVPEPPKAPPRPPRVPPPPRLATPKMPPPPRVEDERPRGNSGDWRDKFRGDSEGREETVTTCAKAICGVLQGMVDEIKMVGGKPVMEVDDLYGPWVLTLDEWLPQDLKIKSEHKAIFGSTGIIVHRFMRRKDIKEALAVEEAKQSFEKQVERRKEEVADKQANNPPPMHPNPITVEESAGPPPPPSPRVNGVKTSRDKEPDPEEDDRIY
jgi:hypothetical protein